MMVKMKGWSFSATRLGFSVRNFPPHVPCFYVCFVVLETGASVVAVCGLFIRLICATILFTNCCQNAKSCALRTAARRLRFAAFRFMFMWDKGGNLLCCTHSLWGTVAVAIYWLATVAITTITTTSWRGPRHS